MKKGVVFVIVIIAAVIIIFGIFLSKNLVKEKIENIRENFGENYANQNKIKETALSVDAKYIVANPLNLTQIEKLSKFRSCAGHDFSGRNFLGEIETNSSMKHYIMPLKEFSDDKTSFYAPFDGKVHIDGSHPEFGQGERGDSLELINKDYPNVVFIFFHIKVPENIKKGDKFKAGQLVGYGATKRDGTYNPDFDMGLRALNRPNSPSRFGNTFDSVFNHMTPEVLSEYRKFGIEKEEMFFTKEFRDANPCKFPDHKEGEKGWIFLKH